MTGEYATATLHFVKGGIEIECEDMGYRAFAIEAKGLMKCIKTINDFMNPDTKFYITEKGEKKLEDLKELLK